MKNFKKWFKLMWRNRYIQLFAMFIAMLTMILHTRDQFDTPELLVLTLSIPVAGMLSIAYFGFYRFWQQVKHLD
jgi:hypothetical protein